jgi:hypothetical protein
MVWKLTHFPESNQTTGYPYDIRGEWSDLIVLQAAQKVNEIVEQHKYDNSASN